MLRTWLGSGALANPADPLQVDFAGQGGLCADAAGNIYAANPGHRIVRRVSPAGVASIAAGVYDSAGNSGNGGPATAALLDQPRGVAADSWGNLYISDVTYHTVRKVSGAGVITLFTGSGADPTGEGIPAVSSALFTPTGLAVDASGAVYICDTNNHRVRRVAPDGTIRTIAGTYGVATAGGMLPAGDGGPATAATLNGPSGIWVAPSGFPILIADSGDNRIRRIDASGVITTLAGTGDNSAAGTNSVAIGDGGSASTAQLNGPGALAADAWGNLYIADTGYYRVRKVDRYGTISTVAGNGNNGFFLDNQPVSNTNVWLSNIAGICVDPQGALYISGNTSPTGAVRKMPNP